MAKFIKFSEDRGIGKQVVFANLDQVTTARFDRETGVLELATAGSDERMHVHGEEAKAAIEALKELC